MSMNHVPLTSSAILSVAYENGVLEVRLTNGRNYFYGGVPPEKHAEFMAAESPGKFYNTQIKGKYAVQDPNAPPDPVDTEYPF